MRKISRKSVKSSALANKPAEAAQSLSQRKTVQESQPVLDTSNEPKSMKSLYLDDLFGFSEARRRLEEKALNRVSTSELDFVPHRIFLNHVDSYHGQILAKFLSEQTVGALLTEEKGEFEGEYGGEGEYGAEGEGEYLGEIEGEDLIRRLSAKDEKRASIIPPPQYEIIGTVKSRKKNYIAPSYLKEVIRHPSRRDLFLPKVMKCGFIIYDITLDRSQIKEAHWVLKAIEAEYDKQNENSEEMNEVRTFILISPVLTWANTKPPDPEDPEVALTEADYRKRKPHKNYKDQCALEKEVMQTGRKYKDKYRTCVVASGVTYGGQENAVLHYLFKKAWLADSDLPVFERGNNLIPMINVEDLASILHNLVEQFPAKLRYIVAMESRPSELYDIVKSISRVLGTGKINRIPKEAAVLDEELTQEVFDALTMNINIEPAYVLHNMRVKWKSNNTFSQNISQLVSDYMQFYQLEPIKILVHGPPAVGKTTVAKQLCEYYKIHYLSTEEVIQHELSQLKAKLDEIEANKFKEEEVGEDKGEHGGESEDQYENVEEINSKIAKLERNIGGNIEEDLLLKLFKERLHSAQCRNQGYVLDDFPQTIEQARYLFDTGVQGENAVEESAAEDKTSTLPDFVISLEANDEFLCNRVMGLTREQVEASKYTEERMVLYLTNYRILNSDETTVLNFFDELEIHPLLQTVEDEDSPQMSNIVEALKNKIGPPKNFGPSAEEAAAEKARQQSARKQELEEKKKQATKEEREMSDAQYSKMEEWARLENILKQEEEEQLALQALPLRHYLMRYILPTLTKGLIEVAKLRPSDPLDYLAEYLFRENPEGKMFEPDYVAAAEDLMNAVHQFQDTLHKIHSLEEVEIFQCPSQASPVLQSDVSPGKESEMPTSEKQSEVLASLPETSTASKLSSNKEPE